MGTQIANGNWSPRIEIEGHPLMRVGPIIPILVGFFIKIFGNPYFPMFIYNILATSFVVPVLFYLGKEVFNRNIGWMIAIWGVLYIDYFKYNPDILKEPTVFLFLPLTLFFLVKSIKTTSYWFYSFLSAITYVWLIHSDERYFLYFPIFALVFFLKRPLVLRKTIQNILIWVGLVFLLMLPWNIHNYKVFNQVVIISSRTTAFTSKIWGKNISSMNFTEKDKSSIYDLEQSTHPIDKLKDIYGVTPREYTGFELYIRAFVNFWQPAYFRANLIQYGTVIQKWSSRHNILSIVFYGIFLPFYIIGLVLLIIKRNHLGLFLAIIPVIHSIIHAFMIWPLERYRSPIVFIVVLIGFWAATELYKNVKNKMVKEI
jgi:4-amino-4-deoxy-L-arabinose transferase-like glycosyltransferase